MASPNPKAYSYIRFSSPDQAKGDSYRRQREAAEKYCALNGLDLISSKDYLFFDKGKSAYKGRHLDDSGELARFLKHVDDGTIMPGSVLIVESLDRLSREKIKDALPRFMDLLNKGINIYTSADQKLYTQDYNDIDLIGSIFQMSRAHSESSLKGERVSKAWRNKQALARELKKPLGAACPHWLELLDGKYQVIKDRAEVIVDIFNMAITGRGHRTIARMLNDRDVPVFGSTKRNVKGHWGNSSVSKILSNRALLGEYQPTGLVDGVRVSLGESIKDFYPSVISEETFYEAQSSRAIRKVSKATKPTKNFNLWQGLAKCGLCRESMHLVNKGAPPKGGKYLRCYGAAKGKCSNKLVALGIAETAFKEILAKVDSLSLVQESQGKMQKDISLVDLKLSEIKSRKDEIQAQVLEFRGTLPKMLLVLMDKLETEEEDLKRQREELRINIQREKIISKEDFFERVDLTSYEGRARANYLLKALGVLVHITRSDDRVAYAVAVESELNFMMYQYENNIDYYPYTSDASDLIKLQGDGAAFAAMHKDMVDRFFALLEDIKKHEELSQIISRKSVPKKLE